MTDHLLTAVVNGIILSLPLTASVWFALRISRQTINAATRYAIWWATLALAVFLPWIAITTPSLTAGSAASREKQVDATYFAIRNNTPPPKSVLATPIAAPPYPQPLKFDPGLWTIWLTLSWAAISSLLLLRLTKSFLRLQQKKNAACPRLRNSKPPSMPFWPISVSVAVSV